MHVCTTPKFCDTKKKTIAYMIIQNYCLPRGGMDMVVSSFEACIHVVCTYNDFTSGFLATLATFNLGVHGHRQILGLYS